MVTNVATAPSQIATSRSAGNLEAGLSRTDAGEKPRKFLGDTEAEKA